MFLLRNIVFILPLLICGCSMSSPEKTNQKLSDAVQLQLNTATEMSFNPTVTLRGLYTGGVWENPRVFPNKDEYVQLQLVEVRDPAFPPSKYPDGILQIRTPRPGGETKCVGLTFDDTELFSSNTCTLSSKNYFTLHPVNTGAVIIQSVRTGKCVAPAGSDIAVPELTNCGSLSPQTAVSPKLLWFIAPAFGAAQMSPAM
ncbi:hypothetical protein E3025_004839 [Salmonella enterica]|nr:hypothetical protein [Salmonella enterica]EFV3714679.1 hypothetical protein [Salmonella enterica]